MSKLNTIRWSKNHHIKVGISKTAGRKIRDLADTLRFYSFDIYPVVGLLEYMIALFIVFQEIFFTVLHRSWSNYHTVFVCSVFVFLLLLLLPPPSSTAILTSVRFQFIVVPMWISLKICVMEYFCHIVLICQGSLKNN